MSDSTKTYSEKRQGVYFKAARDLRKIAAEVLDDGRVGIITRQNARWTKDLARRHAEQANEMEERGHECAVASGHVEAALRRSHDDYSAAIDRFEACLRANGIDPADIKTEGITV